MLAHFTLAKVLEVPELELTEEESGQLAECTRKVAVYYAVKLDPKKLAIVELIFCAGGIYGPRAIAYAKRTAKPRRNFPVSAAAMPDLARPSSATEGPSTAAPVNGLPRMPPPKAPPREAVPSDFWQEEVQDGSNI